MIKIMASMQHIRAVAMAAGSRVFKINNTVNGVLLDGGSPVIDSKI